jgi:hypothetical protein
VALDTRYCYPAAHPIARIADSVYIRGFYLSNMKHESV